MELRKCSRCKIYTLKEKCKKCKLDTVEVKYKFLRIKKE